MSDTSDTLSELDSELLGEVPSNNEAEITMTKTNGGLGNEAPKESHGAQFNPLNATAGTLVKVSSKGGELEPGKVS